MPLCAGDVSVCVNRDTDRERPSVVNGGCDSPHIRKLAMNVVHGCVMRRYQSFAVDLIRR